MGRSIARIKGLGFILWQTRHEFYHMFVGLMWAWYLRELWSEFNLRWIAVSVFGSLVPDLDHVIYFMTYGKRDWYTNQVRTFLRNHQWRTVWKFVAIGHKYNTSLATHNYFFMTGFLLVTGVAYVYDWKAGVILFGAIVGHYLFDVCDDIVMLGHVNANWRRFLLRHHERKVF